MVWKRKEVDDIWGTAVVVVGVFLLHCSFFPRYKGVDSF